MKLALDTNLLAYETPRRFLRNVARDLGMGIHVLPQVHEESLKRIERAEQERWTERLENLPGYTDLARGRIVSAVGAAARQWLDEQCRRQDSGLYLVRPTFEQTWQAHRIARNLPPGVVKRGISVPTGDPLILAQAAVHNVTLLSTNNFKTIDHENANEWFRDHLAEPEPIVRTPDETIGRLCGNDRSVAERWTLAYAPNWTRERSGVREEDNLRLIYEEALDRLAGAGFEETAQKARWSYETGFEQPGQFVRSLDTALHRCTGRDADREEHKRWLTINAAAHDAGFGR